MVLGARSRADLETVAREVEAKGRRAVVQPTDVTDLGQIRALADAAVARLGRIDVWVNNAGGFTSEPGSTTEWLDVTEAGWEAMVRLNLTAQVFGAQAAARVMRDRGTGGSIIFLSSIDSLYAAPGGEGIYGACKAALNNIVQTMAVELGQHRIRVNALAPAVVETPLTAPWLATEADRRKRVGLLSASPGGPARGRRGRGGLLRLGRGRVGVGRRPPPVRGRRDDERSLPLPDASQPGRGLSERGRVRR